MHKQIINLFTNPKNTMEHGIWLSGVEGEGEYKEWYHSGELFVHGFYKESKRDGEYKTWYKNGNVSSHVFFKNGKKDGEHKTWYENGQVRKHGFFKDGNLIKDYLKGRV